MARGNTAQKRRNARRAAQKRREAQGVEKAPVLTAAADEASDDTYFAEIAELGAEFAPAPSDDDGDEQDTPNMGPCSECSHAAGQHEGEMNDGACGFDGCSCMSYVTPQDAKDEPDDEHAAEVVTLRQGSWRRVGPEKPGDSPDDAEPDQDVDDDTKKAKAKKSSLDVAINAAMDLAKDEGKTLTFMLSDFVLEDDALTADGEAPIFTGGARWVATLCPEGKATEDGRIFAPGSITWRELPLSLMGMIETQPGHDGAQVCGRIDNAWREAETGLIRGSGEFDSGEYGQMIARMVGDETLRGVSVDIAPIKVEVAKRSDVVDEAGNWIDQVEPLADEESEDAEGPSLLDLLFGDEDMITVVREGVIGAATVCPFPAFADASIEIERSLVASDQSAMLWTVTQQAGWVVTAQKAEFETVESEEQAPLTASAAGIAPLTPPAEWFDDPMLPELTPLSIDEDGRIFGHAAAWGTCHTGIPGTCTTAPTSETDYAYFHLKEVLCEGGERVAVGTITMDAGHAELDLGRAAATDHYDNTAVAAADVRVGEDEFGIWVAGAVRPDLDEMSARRLRGATLSGDWRAVKLSDGSSNRELIALLAVNVPGFPVPRPQALVASGEGGLIVTAQVAAGMHAGQEGLTVLQQRQAEADAMAEEFAELGRSLES